MTTTIPAHTDVKRHRVVIEFDSTLSGAIARRDRLSDAIVTSDALPYYENVHVSQPVEAPPQGSVAWVLDPGEQSNLMAALMDAIETKGADDDDFDGDEDEQAEHDRVLAEYRALADKLVKAITASR